MNDDKKKIFFSLNPIMDQLDRQIEIYYNISSKDLFNVIRRIKYAISDILATYIRITLLIEKNVILKEQLILVRQIQIEMFELDICDKLKSIAENKILNCAIEKFINAMKCENTFTCQDFTN